MPAPTPLDGVGQMTDEQMKTVVAQFDRDLFETYRQEAMNGKPCEGLKRLNTETFKNRYQVSAKLTPQAYAALYAYAKAKDLSINRAIREILTTYFSIKNG